VNSPESEEERKIKRKRKIKKKSKSKMKIKLMTGYGYAEGAVAPTRISAHNLSLTLALNHLHNPNLTPNPSLVCDMAVW
jgi:hypothetical protein